MSTVETAVAVYKDLTAPQFAPNKGWEKTWQKYLTPTIAQSSG